MSLIALKKIEKSRSILAKELEFLSQNDMNGSGGAWLHFYKRSKENLSFREALVTIVALLGNVSFSNSIPEEQSDIDAILPYSGDAFKDARFPLSNIHNPLSWFKMASAWETFASEWVDATEKCNGWNEEAKGRLLEKARTNTELYLAMVKIGCTCTYNILIVSCDPRHTESVGK
ncbi:hypothetical protein CSR02_00050 [Acetobacter pomorum]|uniref:Uncharacterized protein n=1 Tax=Acetobacter pomorum TaxID=65959 RepID=A0A2G4RG56_9PROT|nr:hypothetical protein [Acetobacter pomorum]PHY95571.1 hypothetical protein CSR02_00050 [Acetobacter pomorum]GBR50063.1 hypothetical protein AA11825_1558 [Acetobacter pomorum DSM 11825]